MNTLLVFVLWVCAVTSGFYAIDQSCYNNYLPLPSIQLRFYGAYVGLTQFYFVVAQFQYIERLEQLHFVLHLALTLIWSMYGLLPSKLASHWYQLVTSALIFANAVAVYWRNFAWRVPSELGVHASIAAIPFTFGLWLVIVNVSLLVDADLQVLQYMAIAIYTLVCLILVVWFRDTTLGLIAAYMMQSLVLVKNHHLVAAGCGILLLVASMVQLYTRTEESTPLLA